MNIFVVDQDPRIAAQSLCDKHVVKMILDSGFDKANFENLFNGIVSIHKAQK